MKSINKYFNLWIPSPLQKLNIIRDYQVFVKRDDLIHSVISGNKFRKLKHILLDFESSGKNQIIAFGGAYSNLLHALSLIVHEISVPTVFYIRGYGDDIKNPTLNFIRENGVDMRFLSKEEFRKIRNVNYLKEIQDENPSAYLIPEGASNLLATYGSAEIYLEIEQQLGMAPDHIIMDMGTGGTFAGVLSRISDKTMLTGIPVLKGVNWERTLTDIFDGDNRLLLTKKYTIRDDYHFGGFAKFNQELIDFINRYKFRFGIDLDPVYTGKLAFAVNDMIEMGEFAKNSVIVWVHGGGLQGIRGFNRNYDDLLL